jgi:Na+-transporting NADH:ubiquinone oxidoreductase subunit F
MLVEIAVPTVVFTSIVVALALLVLAARRLLEPSGHVTATLDGERTIELEAGATLLSALAAHGIYLPAACGGRGACGQCRVTVRSGAGPPLPTELAHLRPAEIEAGARLACMLKVRAPLEIALPRTARDVERFSCTVETSRNVSAYLREIVLKLPEGRRLRFTAGAYVLVEAPPGRIAFRDLPLEPPYRAEWQRSGLLGLVSDARTTAVRAYSLANPPQEDDRIALVVRIATPPAAAPGAPPGHASSYLFSLTPGATVAVSGPFGEFRATDTNKEMVLIAGGAGIAPIRSIVLDQLARGTVRRMSFWYGVRDQLDLCYEAELRALAERHANFDFHAALSSPRRGEPWTGPTGFIHRVVYDEYLSRHPAPQDVEYYLCGPPLMTAAVTQMLETLGVARTHVFFDDFGA